MNKRVIENFAAVRYSLYFFPLIILLLVACFLFIQDAFSVQGYINIQKQLFYSINSTLGQFPVLQINLTQFGDALIFLSLTSLFILYAPAIWESLITASLLSLIASSGLKNLFNIPRPAAALDNQSFIIIGQKLPGYSSLPSGHSITIFTTLTVLLFAFIPQKQPNRLGWILIFLISGLTLAFSRVAVGAHYPLDVVVGSTVGFLSGITGIILSRNYKIWTWVGNKRFYPLFIVLLLICIVAIVLKITNDNLLVYYLALAASIFSLYTITHAYIKK